MATISNNSLKHNEVYNRFIKEIHGRSDKLIEIFLAGYFIFGVGISYFYDTWLVGLSIGGLVLVAYYFSKFLFPHNTVRHYVVSAGIGIFMGQFIYQMHGLFEMHFFAFIGSTLLITYQNWKTLIPLAIVIVAHHAVFGYLQYQSFTTNSSDYVYFTQLDYMDLQTFIFHCSLAVVILVICGLWAYDLNKRTVNNTKNIVEIENLSNTMTRNLEYASLLANGIYEEPQEPSGEDDLLGKALKNIHLKMREKDPELIGA